MRKHHATEKTQQLVLVAAKACPALIRCIGFVARVFFCSDGSWQDKWHRRAWPDEVTDSETLSLIQSRLSCMAPPLNTHAPHVSAYARNSEFLNTRMHIAHMHAHTHARMRACTHARSLLRRTRHVVAPIKPRSVKCANNAWGKNAARETRMGY